METLTHAWFISGGRNCSRITPASSAIVSWLIVLSNRAAPAALADPHRIASLGVVALQHTVKVCQVIEALDLERRQKYDRFAFSSLRRHDVLASDDELQSNDLSKFDVVGAGTKHRHASSSRSHFMINQ